MAKQPRRASLWSLIHCETGMKCTVDEFFVTSRTGLSVRQLRERTGPIPMPNKDWRVERKKGAQS